VITQRGQLRLYFHASLFIVLAMTFGTPGLWFTFNDPFLNEYRQFVRQSHVILILTGIWMITSGVILPMLDLSERAISAIVWMLVSSGYTFIVAITLLGILLKILGPQPADLSQWEILIKAPYHLAYVYMTLITVSGLTSFFPGVLLLVGARNALRQYLQDAIH